MAVEVRFFEDAAGFSAAAGAFLRSRPVHHNLVLTLLDGRLKRPEPGRYWVAERDEKVVGVAAQSHPTRNIMVVPMEFEAINVLAGAIAESGVVLPGVSGDAATAARFAGHWTDRQRCGAFPTEGLRLFELEELCERRPTGGQLRKVNPDERDLVEGWVNAFQLEAHAPSGDVPALVDSWIADEMLWIWQDREAVAMTVARPAIEGVVRLSVVFTPPEKRRRGYAAACVHELSKRLTEAGLHCILYTDLGNPTSNSIYRRLGYRAISEGLHYRFDTA
jgi:ribosomal protein S18 acetylase RimI-like enzyme